MMSAYHSHQRVTWSSLSETYYGSSLFQAAVITLTGAWRIEREEGPEAFIQTWNMLQERVGRFWRDRVKVLEWKYIALYDHLLTPCPRLRKARVPDLARLARHPLFPQAQSSHILKKKEEWFRISRKCWISFIIYTFHFVHILQDIKRLVVMQFVLSINANPWR